MNCFTIRELKVNEDDTTGIQAISFVDKPAIETDFEYFAQNQLLPYFKYVGPKDNKNRPFCQHKIGQVYHVNEINGLVPSHDGEKWTPSSDDAPTGTPFFQNFTVQGGVNYENIMNYNCDSEMFGCRHSLLRVSRKNDVPLSIRHLEPNIKFSDEHFVKMEMSSELKHEVKGLVLKSHQMIYRNDVDGSGNPGYVYFSKDTVKQLQKKYGYNRSISYMHRDSITGQAILMDSWIEEDAKEARWFVKYKIVGDKLWQMIESQVVKGFSIEALFSL